MKNSKFLFVLIPALLVSCGAAPISSATSSSQAPSSEATSSKESAAESSVESSFESSEEASTESSSAEPAPYEILDLEKKSLPFYTLQTAEPIGGVTVPVYYINGNHTIPYFNLSEGSAVFCSLFGLQQYSSVYFDGMVASILNKRGDAIEFNAEANTITFDDFISCSLRYIDPANILSNGGPEGVEGNRFLSYSKSLFHRGASEAYDLSKYGLQLYCGDFGEFYVPADLLFEMMGGDALQGGCIDDRGIWLSTLGSFTNPDGSLNDVGRVYYNPVETVSKEFAEYNYGLLCLDMDMQYGLGYSHAMEDGFDAWATRAGIKNSLLSTNPKEFDVGLATVTLQLLDDVHIKYGTSGIYSGSFNTGVAMGPSRQRVFDIGDEMQAYRRSQCPDFQPYMEIEETAYVTFDVFSSKYKQYDPSYVATNTMDDTITLINYANSQIRRENSPIKNVVLDLSANGGGEADCAAFVLGWMLGDFQMNIRDPKSGSHSRINYRSDVNFDGVFNDEDTIKDLNLYCISTGGSFSCGNLVPSILRASDNVTMLGQTSGGGSCSVLMRTTPSGSTYRISSRHELCTYKNGTYYSVDQGAEPHYFLDRNRIYQRASLTSFIEGLQSK